MSDETTAETMRRSEEGTPPEEGFLELIAERRKLIRDDAPCVGCGGRLADCEAARGEDPTAPPWFGCCARGTGMAPCSHRQDAGALSALLDEVAAGEVRSVGEILQERTGLAARREAARGPVVGSLFDQAEWWCRRDGSFIRLSEMNPGHRYNTAAMIMRNAARHAHAYSLTFSMMASRHDGGDMAHEALERQADEIARQSIYDPQGWVRGTALYRALTAGLLVQGDPTRPWEANGRDPVTGCPCDLPPQLTKVCAIPDCGCSGKAHA